MVLAFGLVAAKLMYVVRCENGLSVETTAWEGWKAQQEGGEKME